MGIQSNPLSSQRKEQSFFKSPIIKSRAHSRNFWETTLISSKKQIFFYCLVFRAIESFQSERYTDFDAHTTANCCHGMSIFVKDLLPLISQFDLPMIQQQLQKEVDFLEKDSTDAKRSIEWIPDPLIDLTALYILAYAIELVPGRGRLTKSQKLREVSPMGVEFCNIVVKNLQRIFSNLIADSYYQYLNELDNKMEISGAPLWMWGKYISSHYLRKDKHQVKYASSMFSMQISLAYLIHSRAKVILKIDLMTLSGNPKGSYVHLFEGDGTSQLRPLGPEEIEVLNPQEPAVVFGSCAFSDKLDLSSLELQMTPWLYQFPSLIQAHEIHYPQFPDKGDRTTLNNRPIVPKEKCLKNVIANLSVVKGVSAEDPSFCCFIHIFPASIKQTLQVITGGDKAALPNSLHFLSPKSRRNV